MPNVHLNIDILDHDWPQLKLIISGPRGVRQLAAPYEIAASQFEPLVKDALKQAVEDTLRAHKKL